MWSPVTLPNPPRRLLPRRAPPPPVILVELMGPDDLGSFLARKRPGFDLGRARVHAWLLDILRALEHLHDRDPILIHRDVKPENLLLTHDRRTLKLADFGLAKTVWCCWKARSRGLGEPDGASFSVSMGGLFTSVLSKCEMVLNVGAPLIQCAARVAYHKDFDFANASFDFAWSDFVLRDVSNLATTHVRFWDSQEMCSGYWVSAAQIERTNDGCRSTAAGLGRCCGRSGKYRCTRATPVRSAGWRPRSWVISPPTPKRCYRVRPTVCARPIAVLARCCADLCMCSAALSGPAWHVCLAPLSRKQRVFLSSNNGAPLPFAHPGPFLLLPIIRPRWGCVANTRALSDALGTAGTLMIRPCRRTSTVPPWSAGTSSRATARLSTSAQTGLPGPTWRWPKHAGTPSACCWRACGPLIRRRGLLLVWLLRRSLPSTTARALVQNLVPAASHRDKWAEVSVELFAICPL